MLSDRVIARELYLLFGRCLFVVYLIAPAASAIAFSDRVEATPPPNSLGFALAEVLRKFISLVKGMALPARK
jgi:hypothetical protein